MNKWTPTDEEQNIIRAERERMLADGVDGREIMRLTTGENRKKLLIEYHASHGLDYIPSWTDEDRTGKEIQKSMEKKADRKSSTRSRKSTTKKEKNVNTRKPLYTDSLGRYNPRMKKGNPIIEEIDNYFDIIPDKYTGYATEYAAILGEDGEKKLHDKDGNYFSGLIRYINTHERYGEELYSSVDNLIDVWKAYENLCYLYNQKPFLDEYAALIGVHRDTLYSWMNGETRKDRGEKASCTRSDALKMMQDSARIGRYKSAAAGNIGGIFLSKAVDGLVETAPAPVYNPVQVQNNMEIASKMGLLLSDNSVDTVVDN